MCGKLLVGIAFGKPARNRDELHIAIRFNEARPSSSVLSPSNRRAAVGAVLPNEAAGERPWETAIGYPDFQTAACRDVVQPLSIRTVSSRSSRRRSRIRGDELTVWRNGMKIGIIGAGSIGGTLARRLAEIGHDVFIANSRGPETLRDLAAQTGATAVTVEQAARDAGVVIVSIPERNIEELPKDLFSGIPDSVVVVDTGNYYPRQRDGRIEAIEAGMPESLWVAAALGRPVIKAFNVMYAERLGSLGKPKGTPARVAIPVAGDDARAKGIVMNLVDELGFDPIDA
ncbi:MAG TPA: NAD(P)-binding domain-containing protein, partial [Candidatus Cybelea sp.]|nr:NAD(P)-binding domain-containing protein [Candidatus Cybelea sp.]